MVRKALTMLLLSLAMNTQAVQLIASLDSKQSHLGQPVVLHLEARGKNLSLEDIDLSPLAAEFEVFSITRSSTNNRAQLDATLYPLRTGELTVPPLALRNAHSKALSLAVTDDPDLSLSVSFTPDTLFERQRSTLLVSLRDKADRQWSSPTAPESSDLLLRPLGERQFEEGSGADHVNVHELRWEALALRAGHQALKLPMLDVYQLGRRLRLPLPVAHLEVRALPSYLPVAVPVGEPGFSAELATREVRLGQPLLWVLRVSAPGFSPDAARSLLHLPSGEQPGLRFYPPGFQQEEESAQGPRALRIELPVVPTQAGTARLPDLSLPYFDPRTMRMEQVHLNGPTLTVIDPFRKQALGVATVVLLLLTTGFVLHRGRAAWERRQARRLALNNIELAQTAGELLHAVCAYSRAPRPRTLQQWLDRLPQDPDLHTLTAELESACFGATTPQEISGLKQRWLAALARRKIT